MSFGNEFSSVDSSILNNPIIVSINLSNEFRYHVILLYQPDGGDVQHKLSLTNFYCLTTMPYKIYTRIMFSDKIIST